MPVKGYNTSNTLHGCIHSLLICYGCIQGDHLSGKPGNVREFDNCQENVSDITKNQGNVGEKILSGKSCLKLFIVNCIFASAEVLVIVQA